MIKSKEELQEAKELGVKYFVYRKQTIGVPVVVRIRHYLADEPYEGTIVSVEEFQWQPWGNAKLILHEATLPELEYVTDENLGDVMKRTGFNWCDVSRDKDLSKYRTFEETTKVKDLPYLGVNHRAQLHEDIRKMMDNLMRDQPIIEDKGLAKYTPVTPKLDPSEEIARTKHYDTSVQPINAMQANLSHEEFRGYCLGNIVKYCLRFGRKNGEGIQKEANKIADYAEFLRVHTLGETIDAKEITSRHREVKQ